MGSGDYPRAAGALGQDFPGWLPSEPALVGVDSVRVGAGGIIKTPADLSRLDVGGSSLG